MILRAVAITVAAGLSVAACGGDDATKAADPTPTASPTTQATVDPKEPACSFLTAAERKKLVGSAIDQVVATSGTPDSSQCRWQASSALIQVTTVPAPAWAKSLPSVVAELEKSGDIRTSADREELARAKKLVAGADSFSGQQACDAFTTLAEIGGAKKGATTTITLVPISKAESGISAQTCTSGQLTSLIYSVPGLERSKQVDGAATTALAAAQRRALAIR